MLAETNETVFRPPARASLERRRAAGEGAWHPPAVSRCAIVAPPARTDAPAPPAPASA